MSDLSSQSDPFAWMFSAADSHAKTYRWLDDVLALLESGAGYSSSSCDWSNPSLPAGFSSKTSLDCCRQTADGTWAPLSGRWQNWGMGGPTGCLTLSGSECPSNAAVCSLSDVLEPTADVPPKFFLSERACRGILRRAEKRGRELPCQLQLALTEAANIERRMGTTS